MLCGMYCVVGSRVLFEMWVVSRLMGGLARLGHPLTITCMGRVGGVWSDDLACLVIPSKLEAVSGCLEVRSSCKGAGPFSRFTSVFC